MCSNKFTNLNTGWSDLDNFYSKKDTLTILAPTNKSCFYDYSILNEDKSNYSLSWRDYNETQIDSSNLTQLAFTFTKSKILKDNPHFGKYGNYLGGGYVYKMIGDLKSIKKDLLSLQQMKWIDHKTRAIFIEFTLYNPNVNLFSYCNLLFELLPTGAIIPTSKFVTINLWADSRELTATCCIVAYLVVIVVLMTKEIKNIKELKAMYFVQFWPYIDWCQFIASWTALPMYLYKLYAQHDLLNYVKENKITYINLSTLSSWNDTLSILLAFCSFLSTIKLIRLLRFNKKISYLTKTITNCSKDLISFMIVLLILWLAYVQLMYIFYNEKTLGYASFVKAMVTNFLIIMGKFDLRPLVETNFTASAIIFSSYNILIVMIMINFVITIISDNFAKAREEAKKIKAVSMFKHLKKKILTFVPTKESQIGPIIDSDKFVENPQYFEIKSIELIGYLKDKIDNQKKAIRKSALENKYLSTRT